MPPLCGAGRRPAGPRARSRLQSAAGLRDKSEHLQGEIRIWNISHATEKSEWQHEIRRAEDPSGPWQDRIYARYAPELVPMALQGVGDVLEKFAQKGATIDVP